MPCAPAGSSGAVAASLAVTAARPRARLERERSERTVDHRERRIRGEHRAHRETVDVLFARLDVRSRSDAPIDRREIAEHLVLDLLERRDATGGSVFLAPAGLGAGRGRSARRGEEEQRQQLPARAARHGSSRSLRSPGSSR